MSQYGLAVRRLNENVRTDERDYSALKQAAQILRDTYEAGRCYLYSHKATHRKVVSTDITRPVPGQD